MNTFFRVALCIVGGYLFGVVMSELHKRCTPERYNIVRRFLFVPWRIDGHWRFMRFVYVLRRQHPGFAEWEIEVPRWVWDKYRGQKFFTNYLLWPSDFRADMDTVFGRDH